MRRLLLAATVAACPVLLSLSAGTFAASPGEGTIDSPKDEVTWHSGPFTASNLANCAGASLDPTCDHFTLRIESAT